MSGSVATAPVFPDERGRFGRFGGAFVPETLVPAIREIEAAYREARADPEPFKRSSTICQRPMSVVRRRSPLLDGLRSS